MAGGPFFAVVSAIPRHGAVGDAGRITTIGLLSTHWALKWLLTRAEKMLNLLPV
jgi:hypothetical protein